METLSKVIIPKDLVKAEPIKSGGKVFLAP